MKEKHKPWLNLGKFAPRPTSSKTPIVLRIFPEIQKLEDAILLQEWRIGEVPERGNDQLNMVSKKLFGIEITESEFSYPEDFHLLPKSSAMRKAYQEDQKEYDNSYLTHSMMDDEIVGYFLPFGIDFRDAADRPLRCTLFLAKVAELVTEGEFGYFPNTTEAELQNLKAILERDVIEFRRKK